jgi:hypothetical protein
MENAGFVILTAVVMELTSEIHGLHGAIFQKVATSRDVEVYGVVVEI